jgi:predicted DNA-binding antitoxin AbrB/MazE fold protein
VSTVTVEAVFENGVFRPLVEPSAVVTEGQHVRLVVELPDATEDILALATSVYDGLSSQEIDELEQIVLDRQDFFGELK